MSARTNSRTVTFKRAFALSGLETLPAGNYTVETEEQQLDVSFAAFQRTATYIFLPALSGGAGHTQHTQMVTVDPLELEAALARDADHPAASST